MTERVKSWLYVALYALLLGWASSYATGCSNPPPQTAAIARSAVTLGFASAAALRAHYDATLAAEYSAHAAEVRAELKAKGGTVEEYDKLMARWETTSGWAAKAELVIATGSALRLLQRYVRDGDVDRDEAAKAVDAALGSLTSLVRYGGLPAELADALALARKGLPELIR